MVLGVFVLLAALIVSAGLGVAVGRLADGVLARTRERRGAVPPTALS